MSSLSFKITKINIINKKYIIIIDKIDNYN